MILALSGLPASGKSTYAEAWVNEYPDHRLRINYDTLRVELFGCKGATYFTCGARDLRAREAEVKLEALHRANAFLTSGPQMDLVVDNTNLTTRARAPWENLARRLGVPYENHEMDTSLQVCIERDRARTGDDRVGRAVIERMALTTGWIDWSDANLYPAQKFVVVDIDGTLSDPSHRLHHIQRACVKCGEHKRTTLTEQGKKTCCLCSGLDFREARWDKFHAEVDLDPPKQTIIDLIKILHAHYEVIIVSGRSPEHGCGIKTEAWLDQHLCEDGERFYRHLFMRQAGDYKPDYEHKQEILDLLPRDRIAFVLDDRDQVVEMWRKNGLTCLQVAKGSF